MRGMRGTLPLAVFLLALTNTTPAQTYPVDPFLMRAVYSRTFRLRDGSVLANVDGAALESMRGNLQRLLAVGDVNAELLPAARALPDDQLLAILLLAVAGNFTVDQSPSALQQQCGIVIDGGTGALILKDSNAAQSVILEVLLIVSIVCLLRAWNEIK